MNFYTSGYAIIQAPEMFSNLFTWVASKRKRKISCTGTGKTSTKQMDANKINYPKKSKTITICSPKNSKNCVVKGQGKAHADKEISEVIEQNVLQLLNPRFEKIESVLENITIRINTLSNNI